MLYRQTRIVLRLLAVSLLTLTPGICLSDAISVAEKGVTRLTAKEGRLHSETAEIVNDHRLDEKRGITLKANARSAVEGEPRAPDVTFNLKADKPGLYRLRTVAAVDDEGDELMKKARGKYDSLFLKLQFDNTRPTRRVVYVPWHQPRQLTGTFPLTGEPQELKIWLPRGVRLGSITIERYVPPAVPKAAVNYQPRYLPPAGHPRLWCTDKTLPLIRTRLTSDEHQPVWNRIQREASRKFEIQFPKDQEISHNAALETAVTKKAFCYLMTGNRETGREAVQLYVNYLERVEFGNVLDITREIGRAIYTGSLVFDWCHDLLSSEEQDSLTRNMMRLAMEMECGWPPFGQSIITGHGAEAQINRDLLAMSIALYDQHPEAFRYTSYVIQQNLVPMRTFEYQSPRFDQGISYGDFRFGWEMHAAWLFYRLTGQPVFDDNLKEVRRFWQYLRTPDGQMLRDGDGSTSAKEGSFTYWKFPQTALLMYTYANDPLMKADFYRQGGPTNQPILFLLLNDPDLKPVESMDSLPLTKDFGPILGSMVARTGWDISLDSNDVVAEIKGGGYYFGNHQHADAGALQIYYRGLQVVDLGLYRFYGTPYDRNFNKRSIAHSMMLARDPAEKFAGAEANDGGIRSRPQAPRTKEQTLSDPQFNNGTVLSAAFGPSPQKPAFSYFKVDLTRAYSSKLTSYTREFSFLNLCRKDVPAAIILFDDMTTRDAAIQKYWQVNSLFPPELTESGVVLHNERKQRIGKTHINMLLPVPADRTPEVLSGPKAHNVFGMQFDPPDSNRPERTGHRIMFSPTTARKQDQFLTVFQMVDGESKPLSIGFTRQKDNFVIGIADRVVSLSNSSDLIHQPHSVTVPSGSTRQIACLGLKPGTWHVRRPDGTVGQTFKVTAGKNVLFFEGGPGQYTITPE